MTGFSAALSTKFLLATPGNPLAFRMGSWNGAKQILKEERNTSDTTVILEHQKSPPIVAGCQ